MLLHSSLSNLYNYLLFIFSPTTRISLFSFIVVMFYFIQTFIYKFKNFIIIDCLFRILAPEITVSLAVVFIDTLFFNNYNILSHNYNLSNIYKIFESIFKTYLLFALIFFVIFSYKKSDKKSFGYSVLLLFYKIKFSNCGILYSIRSFNEGIHKNELQNDYLTIYSFIILPLIAFISIIFYFF